MAPEEPREPGPADKLAALLENAPPEVRREIIAWLFGQPRPPAATPSVPWFAPTVPGHLGLAPGTPRTPAETAERVRQLAGSLPAGVDNQVVTLRLPATRHAALRAWCTEHGFSMAAVVRGLVERFLEEQTA